MKSNGLKGRKEVVEEVYAGKGKYEIVAEHTGYTASTSLEIR